MSPVKTRKYVALEVELYNKNLQGNDLNIHIHYPNMNNEHPNLETTHSRNLKLRPNPKCRPATLSECNACHDPFIVALGMFQSTGQERRARTHLEIECPLIKRAWSRLEEYIDTMYEIATSCKT